MSVSTLVRVSLVAGLVAGLMIGADAVAQPDGKLATAAELFPMKKGAMWTYYLEPDDITKKNRYTYEVLGTEVRDTQLCYKVRKQYNGRDGFDCYYTYKDDGLYHASTETVMDKDVICSFDPPVCILKDEKKEVQAWKAKSKGVVISFDGNSYQHATDHSVTQYREQINMDGNVVSATVVHHEFGVVGSWNTQVNGKLLAATYFQKYDSPRDRNVVISWHVKNKGVVKRENFVLSGDRSKRVYTLASELLLSTKGLGGITASSINVNKADVESNTPVVVDSYRLEAGDSAKFKFSRTITRDVAFSVKAGTEVEIAAAKKLDLKLVQAEVSGKVKSAVEASVGTKFEASETREREVTITNTTNKIREGKIVWIDTYRTGTVKVTQDDKEYEVQFRFPTGTRLESRNKE